MRPPAAEGLELEVLDPVHAVCRLSPDEPLPDWVRREDGALVSVTHTDGELSVVCAESLLPGGVERSGGWRAVRVAGTLEHTLTGVLAGLATPLAESGIPIFAISSFDTDYLLVPSADLDRALEALGAAGHRPPAQS